MFLVNEEGVIVVDAPQAIGDKIFAAVSEVTDRPITHLIYSHAHKDHIGAANLFENVTIIAHNETAKILNERNDTDRPVPDTNFTGEMNLPIGNQSLQLLYPGPYHQHGNVFVYLPEHRVWMAVTMLCPAASRGSTLPILRTSLPSSNRLTKHWLWTLTFSWGTRPDRDKARCLVQQEYVADLSENAMADK